MQAFEIQYSDQFGTHAEVYEGWDREDAIGAFRAAHSGLRYRLLDVIPLGAALACA